MSNTKVMTIKCKKCKAKVFKYLKVGKGNLLRAYKSKIQTKYYSEIEGKIVCHCGHEIAIDCGNFYKMLDLYKYE